MKHSTGRKLIRTAALSVLALTAMSGVAGVAVMTASPAMSQPSDLSAGSALRSGLDQPDPPLTPTPTPTPVPPLPVPGAPG
jgi:hypothetical protein